WLPVSPVALSNYVRYVCAERVAAWEQAMATRSGLVDHIVGTMGMSISETPWLENSVDLLDQAATVAEPSRHPVSTLPVNLRPSPRRWWIIGGITTVALALAIGIVGRPGPKPPEPPKIEVPLPTSPKAEPAPPPKVEQIAPAPAPVPRPPVVKEVPPPPRPAAKAVERPRPAR